MTTREGTQAPVTGRNALVIAYNMALLAFVQIKDQSAFVICMSMWLELVIFTLIVFVFSFRSLQDLYYGFILLTLSTVVLCFQGVVFLSMAAELEEDIGLIVRQTFLPVSLGLIATYSLTIYRIIKHRIPIEDLRVQISSKYFVIYGAGAAGCIAGGLIEVLGKLPILITMAVVRILIEYDFFRKPKPESEIEPGFKGFVKLPPTQQAERILDRLRRLERLKKKL